VAQSNEDELALPDSWQQGDIIELDGLPFMYLADLRNPTLSASKEFIGNQTIGDGENPYAAISVDVKKFVVISQTCDLVRTFSKSPTIQLAALEKVSKDQLANSKRRTSIRYLFLPTLEHELYVADLDKIVTVEKAVLLAVDLKTKICAVGSDDEAQVLSDDIARKFTRFAFPDDFSLACSPIRDFVIKNHNKQNSTGQQLRSIIEIRVASSKGWLDMTSTFKFLFFFEERKMIDDNCEKSIQEMINKFAVNRSYPEKPTFQCLTFEDITAAAYRRSPLLDLNFLSIPKE
jgi:hypothetical protein